MYQEVIKIESGNARVVTFDSMREFVEPKQTANARRVAKKTAEELESNIQWYGASSKAEYFQILEHGHSRYVELVRNCKADFNDPMSLKRRTVRGDYGDEICVHALNMGNASTAWRRRSPKVRAGFRNLRLIVNLTQSAHRGEGEMKWVGVAALAAAEAFELAGYRVAIDAFMGADGFTDKESAILLTPLKIYEMPLDVQGLTSMLCFPGFYRGPGFMNWGLAEGDIHYGYGRPINMDVLRNDVIPKYYRDPSELVETISNDTYSRGCAEKEIQRLIARFGSHQEAA